MSSPPQERKGLTRREFLWPYFPGLTMGGFLLLSAACQGKTEDLDSLLKAPLKLPPEPKFGEVGRSLEILLTRPTFIYSGVYDSKNSIYPMVLVKENGERVRLDQDIDLKTGVSFYYDHQILPSGEVALDYSLTTSQGEFKWGVALIDLYSRAKPKILEEVVVDKSKFSPFNFKYPNRDDLVWESKLHVSKDGSFISLSSPGVIWETKTGKIIYGQEDLTFRPFFWSPKNNEVVVEKRERMPGYIIMPEGTFFLLNLDSHTEIPLPQLKTAWDGKSRERFFWRFGAWSPDGEKMAFFKEGTEKEILLIDRQGRSIKQLGTKGFISNVQFSPDGEYVAAFRHEGESRDYLGNSFSTTLIIWDFKKDKKWEFPIRGNPGPLGFVHVDYGFLHWFSKETLLLLHPRLQVDHFEKDSQGEQWSVATAEPALFYFLPIQKILTGEKQLKDADTVTVAENIRITDVGTDRLVLKLIMPEDWKMNPSGFYGNLTIFDLKGRNLNVLGRGARLELFEKSGEERDPSTVVVNGDIVWSGKEFYRVINEKKYSLNAISETFKQKSGFKGQVLKVSAESLEKVPEGVIANELVIFDWAGRPRRNNKEGGRKIVYGSGLLTKTGAELPLEVSLDSTFPEVRRVLREKGDFQEEDNFYFTYDKKKNWFGYKRTDTMQDPLESIALFSELIKEWKEAHPLDNLNLICHSLGGVIALLAAYEHLEIINNIITLDSPLRGLPPILDKNLSQTLLLALGEKVASFLLRAWDDKAYQERLKQIITKAKDRGVGIYTFASTDDLIVPWQSAVLDEATTTIGSQTIELAFSMGISKLNPLDFGHGQVLDNSKILNYVSEIVGKRNF